MFNASTTYGSNRWQPKDLQFNKGETKYTLKIDVSNINSALLGGNMSLFLSHATNGDLGEIRNTTITFSSETPANKSASESDQLSKGAASFNIGYLMFALALLLLMRRIVSRTFTFRMP